MVGYDLSVPPPPPQKPAWLQALLSEKFFVPCTKHAALKKNERNVFCVDCNGGVCQHCVSSARHDLDLHSSHCLLQIRRYVYHDVIRLQEMQRLVDCSQVQTYIVNSSRVVFLNQRPQPRPSKGLGNACATCDRSLQDSYSYCSVACKVDAKIRQGRRLCHSPTRNPKSAAKLHTKVEEASSLMEQEQEQEQEDGEQEQEQEQEEEFCRPASDDSNRMPTTQTSSNRSGGDGGTVVSTAASALKAMPKKMRSGRLSVLAISPKSVLTTRIRVPVKRRKGIPHRSPVC